MKIIITDGCVAGDTTIDGFSIGEFDKKQFEDFLDKVLAKVREDVMEHAIAINSVIELMQYDNYESDEEPCDQCGDSVSTTTWEI